MCGVCIFLDIILDIALNRSLPKKKTGVNKLDCSADLQQAGIFMQSAELIIITDILTDVCTETTFHYFEK